MLPSDTSQGETAGFAEAAVRPAEAFYSSDLREFILPYGVVRQAPNPDETLLDFWQTTYEAGADLAGWERQSLAWDGPKKPK